MLYVKIVEAVVLVILNVLDVISTNQFLKSGREYEANKYMAWVQQHLKSYWWVVKIAILLPIVVLFVVPKPYDFFFVGLMMFMILYYISVVVNNFQLNKK